MINSNTPTSQKNFNEARKVLPGGVNSPVRACRSVDSKPLFIDKGSGCRITDVDGNTYIDYVLSFGPLLLGHAHPKVVSAIQETAALGMSFGAPTSRETELAQTILGWLPGMDKIRFVNSGTEATMSAIRLARGVTGRDKIIKFDGCYHGHGDSFLVKAGSGSLTLGLADSQGVPDDFAKLTISIPFNDTGQVEQTLKENKNEIAAIIIEPVVGNAGVILPDDGFLENLRQLCDQHGTLLVFDEVMTGFRIGAGTAAAHYGITPDLICLGKVIGGGLPVGAYAGKSSLMDHIAPLGDIYQAGTLSGNPIAMAAGLANLQIMKEENHLARAEGAAEAVVTGLQEQLKHLKLPFQVVRFGTLFSIFFNESPVRNYIDAKRSNTETFKTWYHNMLAEGIYLAPSQFEAAFTSSTHDHEAIIQTQQASLKALQSCN